METIEVVVGPDRQAARPARRGHRRRPHRRARAALRAPAATLRAEPPPGSARPAHADRRRRPLAPVDAAGRVRGAARPHRRGGARAASCCTPRSRPTSRPRTPRSSTTTSWSGWRRTTSTGTPLGEVTGARPRRRPGPAADRTPDGREALVPFVAALVPEVDVAGGRVVVADRPGLVTPFPEDES